MKISTQRRKEELNTEQQSDRATEGNSSSVLSPQSSVLPSKSSVLSPFFLLYGLAALLWLSVEDNAMLPVTLFGWVGAALAVLHWGRRYLRNPGVAYRLVAMTALGGAAGAAAALITPALMLLKTGMHSHINPDYLPGQFLAVFDLAPIWALAGGLAGLGLALVWVAVHTR
jgi:hypothetical protein